MCNECCKEFWGWCRAFTRTERALALLELVLLAVCVAGLAFFVLHLLACSQADGLPRRAPPQTTAAAATATARHTTLDPKIDCTWDPSAKTKATTHNYMLTKIQTIDTTPIDERVEFEQEAEVSDSDTDGEEVRDEWKSIVLALVKMRPPNDITFGCILTVVGEFWTITAASCIEAIEELDSLDSFIMMEDYGSPLHGRVHAIADVRVHPLYGETNGSYDAAALRSHDSLAPRRRAAPLAPLDFALLTLGTRFHILGYGAFRSVERGAGGRRLRAAHVYRLPRRSCPEEGGAGAGATLRHLWGGRAAAAAAPAAAALCGGAAARGAACHYCGGTPLLGARRGALVALMRHNRRCGLSCEPQLYTPLALLQDWLRDLDRQ